MQYTPPPAGRAVTKDRGPGISHGYYEHDPRLLLYETKEIPSCLIPRLLIVYTRQLEILSTALPDTLLGYPALCPRLLVQIHSETRKDCLENK